MRLFNFFTQELAIDLGTANTLIIQDGKVVVGLRSAAARALLENRLRDGCARALRTVCSRESL